MPPIVWLLLALVGWRVVASSPTSAGGSGSGSGILQKSANVKQAIANWLPGDPPIVMGQINVDPNDVAQYSAGYADAPTLKRLGAPFVFEAALSRMAGMAGVCGPILANTSANLGITTLNIRSADTSVEFQQSYRVPDNTGDAAISIIAALEPKWNNEIDGYTAKLQYLAAGVQKYGRPGIFGWEDLTRGWGSC